MDFPGPWADNRILPAQRRNHPNPICVPGLRDPVSSLGGSVSESGSWQPPAPLGGSRPPIEPAGSGEPPPVPTPAVPEWSPAPPSGSPVPPAPPPGQFGGPPVDPTRPPVRDTDGFAIAALFFGIIGFVPLALIFGLIALRGIRRQGSRGRGLAIAGIAAGAGWAFLISAVVLLNIFVDDPITDEAVTPAAPAATATLGSTTSAADLVVGDCFVDIGAEEATGIPDVQVVPCSQAHHVEVIAAFNLADGTYPGDDRVTALAEAGCQQRIPAELADARNLELLYLYPLESSWVLGDREIICVLSSRETLTAPLRR